MQGKGDQFTRLHGELRGGGFSEHLPTATKPPSNSYMVSDYGTEERIPKGDVTPGRLQSFAHGHGLNAAPTGEYMGGWSPPEQPDDFLDKSRAYPDIQRGRQAMVVGNQMAMYDTNKPVGQPDAYISNEHYEEGATPSTPWLLPSREKKMTLTRSAPRERR